MIRAALRSLGLIALGVKVGMGAGDEQGRSPRGEAGADLVEDDQAGLVLTSTAFSTTMFQSAETTALVRATPPQMTVEASRYLVARLQSEAANGILRVTRDTATQQIVRLGSLYTLTIGCDRNAPDHYRGARVKHVELLEPVTLEFEATSDGFRIETRPGASPQSATNDSWFENLVIDPRRDGAMTFYVTPQVAGKARLSVQVFHREAWVQRVDLDFEVKRGEEFDLHVAVVKSGGPIDGDHASIEAAVETATTLSIVPKQARRTLQLNCRLNRTDPAGMTYAVRAKRAGSDWRPLKVTLREKDLVDINAQLRGALDRLRGIIGDSEATTVEDAALRDEAIQNLIDQGIVAFKMIFQDKEDRAFLHEIADDANVEIRTDRFFVPWELLYFDKTCETTRLDRFCGFNWNVSRILTNIPQRAPPSIIVRTAPRVAMFVDPELDYARDLEAAFLRDLAGRGEIMLWDWDLQLQAKRLDLKAKNLGSETKKRILRQHFIKFSGERESDVAHFACHAVVDPKIMLNSYLELSRDLAITLGNMIGDDYVLGGAPLVILNACGTSVRDPSRTADFVHKFIASGGRGVVATECDIPDRFASRFIQEVYHSLLSGKTIGAAVLSGASLFLHH